MDLKTKLENRFGSEVRKQGVEPFKILLRFRFRLKKFNF